MSCSLLWRRIIIYLLEIQVSLLPLRRRASRLMTTRGGGPRGRVRILVCGMGRGRGVFELEVGRARIKVWQGEEGGAFPRVGGLCYTYIPMEGSPYLSDRTEKSS